MKAVSKHFINARIKVVIRGEFCGLDCPWLSYEPSGAVCCDIFGKLTRDQYSQITRAEACKEGTQDDTRS